jgi:hypothetical protein
MKFNTASHIAIAALTASTASGFVSPAHNFHSPSFVCEQSTALNMGMFGRLFGKEKAGLNIPPPEMISEGQVRSLFYLWNDALATEDPRLVAKRYADDFILLPTVSDEPRTT